MRDHLPPDEDDFLADAGSGPARRPASKLAPAGERRMRLMLILAVPILFVIALLLAGCELGVALGLGLPRNDACRDVDTSPGQPISNECLDTIGKSPTTP